MKILVKKPFYGKKEKKLFSAGDIITLEEKRVSEINKTDIELIEILEKDKPKKEANKK